MGEHTQPQSRLGMQSFPATEPIPARSVNMLRCIGLTEVSTVLPSRHRIDYATALPDSGADSVSRVVSHLTSRLPQIWRDVYVNSISHQPNLLRFRHGTFEYLCDAYSQLELTGSIPFDQTVQDRVIGVFGRSSAAEDPHRWKPSRLELSEELEGTARDDGHFMARSIGGGLDANLFSQERLLNRGWSAQGKIYRQMERYCRQHEGTFCFSRPIYSDGSNIPRWLEFGVLKTDATLWVEIFEN
jgi:hypothetical protein